MEIPAGPPGPYFAYPGAAVINSYPGNYPYMPHGPMGMAHGTHGHGPLGPMGPMGMVPSPKNPKFRGAPPAQAQGLGPGLQAPWAHGAMPMGPMGPMGSMGPCPWVPWGLMDHQKLDFWSLYSDNNVVGSK